MSEHFCTYFDHHYAPKGLAMWRSLKRHCVEATLHVLCLSEACAQILGELHLPDVHLYSLSALERADPDLAEVRGNRSLVEYYFTLTPCLPLHILKTSDDVLRLTYVDADLFFFADPQPIMDEIGEAAIGVIEHRFPDDLVDLERYGRFNVGWLTFRNNATALRCLEVWRGQCLDWCYDRLESGRFAEQKYLDEWPLRYGSVRIIEHRGANVAPWNLNRFEISVEGNALRVGGHRLLFYHAHGFEPPRPGRSGTPNLTKYGVKETPLLRESIFAPYEHALVSATTEIAVPLALTLTTERSRERLYLLESLTSRVSYLEKLSSAHDGELARRLEQVSDLETKLETSEIDRTVKAAAIQTLEAECDSRATTIQTLEAECRSRAATIQTLEAECDSRAATIQTLEAEGQSRAATIQTLEAECDSRAATIRTLEAEGHSRAATIQTLEAEILSRAATIQTLDAECHRRAVAIQTLEAECQTLQNRIHAHETESRSRQNALAISEANLADARHHIRRFDEVLKAIQSSRSWRWTKPLRFIKDGVARTKSGE